MDIFVVARNRREALLILFQGDFYDNETKANENVWSGDDKVYRITLEMKVCE